MNPVFSDVFTEMAVLLLVASVIGAIGMRLRQPLIVAFIAVGILVGPSVLGWVSANEQVDFLAKLGIALLLFVVGLKLDLHPHHGPGGAGYRPGAGLIHFGGRLYYRQSAHCHGLMGAMGYRKRTGFLAGLTVAQISEFSLILGAVGLSLGHIDADTLGLITLVGLITISASTYMILYSHPLYEKLAPWLGVFERKQAHREEKGYPSTTENGVDIILFGLGRFGQGIAQTLRQRGYWVLGVDFDPDLVRRHEGEGYSVRYGDAEAPEFLASLPLEQVQWVLSSVPEKQVNLALLHGLHEQDYKGRVTVTAHSARDAEHLKDAGADRVLIPYADAATEAVDSLFGVNDRQPSEVANKSHTYPVEF